MTPRLRTPAVLTLSAALVAGLSMSSAASAGAGAPFAPRARTGGYLFTAVKSMNPSTEFTVPTVTCHSNRDGVDVLVGIDNASSDEWLMVGVRVRCTGGTAHYDAIFAEPVDGATHIHGNVHAGDVLDVHMFGWSTTSGGQLDDTSQGWGIAFEQDTPVVPTRAGVFVSDPVNASGKAVPLADFGKLIVASTHVRAGRDKALVMTGPDGPRVADSTLASGGGFTVKWLHD